MVAHTAGPKPLGGLSWSACKVETAAVLFAMAITALLHAVQAQTALVTNKPGVATGTLLIRMTTLGRQIHNDILFGTSLLADSGVVYGITFCSTVHLEALTPNARVRVWYQSISRGVMRSCAPPQLLGGDSCGGGDGNGKGSSGCSGGQQGDGGELDGDVLRHRRQLSGGGGADHDGTFERRRLFGDVISTPTTPSYLVFLTTMCQYDQPVAATEQMVYDLFNGTGLLGKSLTSNDFYNRTGPLNRNLGEFYTTCSYGQVRPPYVQVVGPVHVPCTGSLDLLFSYPNGNSFDTLSCKGYNIEKWQYWLEGYARFQGVNPGDFTHQVMVLPKGFTAAKPDCKGFSGSGTYGTRLLPTLSNPYGTGFIWMSGDFFHRLEYWLHEAAHNLGLFHASTTRGCSLGDQCDPTCTMGAIGGQGIRCFNAPHNWQLGWGRPLRQLAEPNLPIGSILQQLVPPQNSGAESFLMVMPLPGAASPTEALYISVRLNAPPYDLPFESAFNGVPYLLVHSYRGTRQMSLTHTVVLAQLGVGTAFVHNATGLTVRFSRWVDEQGALASLCRRVADTEQVCGDGTDDDCDFLPDSEDPDCAGRLAPAKGDDEMELPDGDAGMVALPPQQHPPPLQPPRSMQPSRVPRPPSSPPPPPPPLLPPPPSPPPPPLRPPPRSPPRRNPPPRPKSPRLRPPSPSPPQPRPPSPSLPQPRPPSPSPPQPKTPARRPPPSPPRRRPPSLPPHHSG